VTWRNNVVYHNTLGLDLEPGDGHAFDRPSSNFSWCAVDRRDNSVHVVNTVREGVAIDYNSGREGSWSPVVTLAEWQLEHVSDGNHVGPTIDVDSDGYRYVAFSGTGQIPYFFAIDPDGVATLVYHLDLEGGSQAGGQSQNPNVGAHHNRLGAFVAWGDGRVYVRGIGLP